MALRAVPGTRKHDLPPVWDGRRVEWRGWRTLWSTADIEAPRHGGKRETCHFCGAREKCATNQGLVYPLAGETVDEQQGRKTPSGRRYYVTRTVPARRLYLLSAFRCPSCHGDVVWDRRDDTWWDLDESDYGDGGSTDGALPGL